MGKNSKIKKIQRQLKSELSKINQDLTEEQRNKLYEISRKNAIKQFLNKVKNG